MVIIEAKNLIKKYRVGDSEIMALNDVSFKINEGELVVILGASGAGKSTLLNILGGMDRPTNGSFLVKNKDISKYSDKELSKFRRNEIGFVFQFYSLIASLNAYENVSLAAGVVEDSLDSLSVLESVGLKNRITNFPSELSGGEQQRVAIARAIVKKPAMLLCDEPTGALDSRTGQEVLKILQDMSREKGRVTIIVTHNQEIAKLANHVIKLSDGKIIEETFCDKPKKVSEIVW
ncbi:ABC transporter ATP-binding protein [Candidatus Gracilibacteria bacterium]|nr:MAG: ABC transporter ATP-binding protein [Candidatus Gracilibacteria bacterium]